MSIWGSCVAGRSSNVVVGLSGDGVIINFRVLLLNMIFSGLDWGPNVLVDNASG